MSKPKDFVVLNGSLVSKRIIRKVGVVSQTPYTKFPWEFLVSTDDELFVILARTEEEAYERKKEIEKDLTGWEY